MDKEKKKHLSGIFLDGLLSLLIGTAIVTLMLIGFAVIELLSIDAQQALESIPVHPYTNKYHAI